MGTPITDLNSAQCTDLGNNNSPVWDAPSWTHERLMELKKIQNRTIAVVLPALNEEKTVVSVIESIFPLLGNLVDELWVIDSGSSDKTVEKAQSAGAQVITREAALPEIAPVPGKGEVLWRSLGVVKSDIVAFIDSDLIDPDPLFVPKLVGPLLSDQSLQLSKAYYRRPLVTDSESDTTIHNGGRVTELVARPLLSALHPEVSQIIQPLGGEYAVVKDAVMKIPFAPGYGVEIGIVLDIVATYGIEKVGQVNLGVRKHRNRPLSDLGVMSRQVVGTILSRSGVKDSGSLLTQFVVEDGHFVPKKTSVRLEDRPPYQEVL